MIAARLIETRKSASRSARKAASAGAASQAEGRLQKSSKPSKPLSENEARVSPQEELHVLKAAQARHRRLLDRKIEFVSGLEFRTGDQEPAFEAGAFDEPVSEKAAPKGLPAYLAGLYATTLLTREDEADLFRRMNLLKFQAVAGREALDAERPDSAAMDEIEARLREAEDIRNRIIRSNLRLVVKVSIFLPARPRRAASGRLPARGRTASCRGRPGGRSGR